MRSRLRAALPLAALLLLPALLGSGAATVQAAPADAPRTPLEPAFTPKPTAPIGIAHRFASEPAVGAPLVITLEVTPAAALGNAVLTLGAGEALPITAPQAAELALGTIAAGETATVELTVVPLETGNHYLSVSVSGDIRGQRQTRNVAVAVRLADSTPRKAASEVAGKSEESVRSLTAEETVR